MTKCKALTGSVVKGLNAHLLRVHCIAFLYELFILLSINDLLIPANVPMITSRNSKGGSFIACIFTILPDETSMIFSRPVSV